MSNTGKLNRPRIVVTGSPGHLGRHVLDAARSDYQVVGVSGRSQSQCGVPLHPDIAWIQAEITDRDAVEEAWVQLADGGDVEIVIFLGEPGDDEGLRNVLEACRTLVPGRFIYASSDEAACGGLIDRYEGVFPRSRIQFVPRPRVVVVGASGFIGRHLIETVQEDFQVFGLARSSQERCGLPLHPNVSWHQVDIADRQATGAVFRRIAESGGVDLVIHLAAYYDFTGEDHPEYQRTNVDGLRNVLEACRELSPRRFVFVSSVAASEFPVDARPLTESSPADGRHVYARTKRIGEEMLEEYRPDFPSVIVRLGAVFSDWCEYPPVFVSLERWRTRSWDSRILGGRGRFAIPYLHVYDVQAFFRALLVRIDDLEPGEVLLASTDEPTSLAELYRISTRYLFGAEERLRYVPRPLCRAGMLFRDGAGRLVGRRPFERPWMATYIDRQMSVNAGFTRLRLGWAPRERLTLLRRVPFLAENLKNSPVEWNRRNNVILKRHRPAINLRIHGLLEQHEVAIGQRLRRRMSAETTLGGGSRMTGLPRSESSWSHQLALHQLMNAVRTRDMSVFVSFCHDLAERRYALGFSAEEVCSNLHELGEACIEVLRDDPATKEFRREIVDHIGMTVLFGRDQVEETYERIVESLVRRGQGLKSG